MKGGCPSLGWLGKCFLGGVSGLEKWVEFGWAERPGEGGPDVDTAWALAEFRMGRRACGECNGGDAGGESGSVGLGGVTDANNEMERFFYYL